MNKTKLLFIFIIPIIIFTGCSSKQYEEAIEKGKTSIEENKYEEASMFFEEALIEKPDDPVAKTYLSQTKNTITAYQFLKEGDLEKSEENFKNVLKVKEGSSTLKKVAKENLSEIEKLTAKLEELDSILIKINQIEENGELVHALDLVNETLEQELNHAVFSSIKTELESSKENLIKLEKNIEIVEKEKETQAKEQEMINQIKGYWRYSENKYDFCSFTEVDYVCPTIASDFVFYGQIKEIKADLANETIILNIENEPPIVVSIPDENTLYIRNGKYTRVSKAEMKNILIEENTDSNVDDFFDIEVYEQWEFE